MSEPKKWYYTDEMMRGDLLQIIRDIEKSNWRPEKIVGISRGGLIPANYLSQWYDIPMFSYHLSLRDHKRVDTWEPGLINAIKGKKILIIDDICDSGKTFDQISQMIEHHDCSPKFACLLNNMGQDLYELDYYGTEINKVEEPQWVVFPWEDWWV